MKSSITLARVIIFLTIPIIIFGCQGNGDGKIYYKGSVIFPDTASLRTKEYMSSMTVPLPRQHEWQKMEMAAFIHFSINTFTDKEWGDGTEPESLFNPTELNTEQWVKTLSGAGMKMVILTAKHHDGFCLWPTETTEHSVRNSPWKNGSGDVVKELRKACDKYDMKFGIYLSPWDMNAKCYGDSTAYNRFFMAQLAELLTWYGQIDEVWFDGACGEGPDGKRQEYDWDSYYELVRRLQPEAVIAIMGEDARWVGTESGYGRETEWSVTALAPGGRKEMREINEKLSLNASSEDLGSRNILQKADRVFWYPSEADVSIRPGWFYHASEDDSVKSVNKLADIYFSSVGRNSLLLLNVPPDRRGLINETDIKSLMGLRHFLDTIYATDLLKGSRPYGYGTSYAIDGDNTSSWNPAENNSVDFLTPISVTFNVAMLQEDITKGQHVDSFTIEIKKGDIWKTIATGTTIGYKRLLRFPSVTSDEIRLTINSSRGNPHISTFSLFKAPEEIASPLINRDKQGNIILSSDSPFAVIKYTTDGKEPTRFSDTWEAPVPLRDGGTVKCKAWVNNFSDSSATFTEVFDIAPLKWTIVKSDASARGMGAENAIDGDIKTIYYASGEGITSEMPHEIIIDMADTLKIYGFTYTPRCDKNKSGTIEKYRLFISLNGKRWIDTHAPGVFANMKEKQVKQTVWFKSPSYGRYVKFIAISGIYQEQSVSIAEFGIRTRPDGE